MGGVGRVEGGENRMALKNLSHHQTCREPLQHLVRACSPLSAGDCSHGERGSEAVTVSGVSCRIQQLFPSDAYHAGLGYKDGRVELPRFRHLCALFS